MTALRQALVAICIGYPTALASQQPPPASSARLSPTDAERIATDLDTRSHDYDIVHQRIELSSFDWDSTSLDGQVATTVIAERAGLDSVILDAGAGLAVSRVMTPVGALLRTGRHGDTLVVYLGHAVGYGDTVRFTVRYHARIQNGRGLTFIQPEGRPHRPEQIWSQGEAQDNHLWFPTYDFPNDKMTWDIVATVPLRFTVVSNGRLVSDRRVAPGLHTVYWSQDRPASTYLVSIVVAPLAHLTDHWHGIPVDYYVYHEDSALARRALGVTPDMIDVYSQLTGIPYPWAKYAQTSVADFFGGMENVSATTLVDWLPDSAAYHDRPWFQYILVPHELAHQWFGDYATTENWANTWLNEGFAEFMPGQYWATKLGGHASQDYYLDEYRQYLDIERGRSMPVAALGSNNIYPKGALVLEMLRHYLGPQRFWAAIHFYLVRHALGTAITEDLREAVLHATGENLTWFWDQWLYSAGLPTFVVSARYDAGLHEVALGVRQTQGDSASADSTDSTGGRFTTPAVFRMPVTIRVGTADSDIVTRAELNAREQSITIQGVRGPPTMVVFDDGNGILKQLEFDQPTPWLAVQLRRDPNLWNRAWTISELRRRSTDSAAAVALVDAALHADYALTRQEAVEALSAFPRRWVGEATVTATHDTSAAVRLAAASTVGKVDSLGARDQLRSLLHDPSYEVRAAALGALARLDAAHRSEIIAQGLGTPSYRDAIQDAAIGAAVALNDSAVIPRLDSLARSNRSAMMALGGFARQGNLAALDLLKRALDDNEVSVRQSALFAIVRTLPPAQALDALRTRVDGLTHPDTRSLVETLIHRLQQRVTTERPSP